MVLIMRMMELIALISQGRGRDRCRQHPRHPEQQPPARLEAGLMPTFYNLKGAYPG